MLITTTVKPGLQLYAPRRFPSPRAEDRPGEALGSLPLTDSRRWDESRAFMPPRPPR